MIETGFLVSGDSFVWTPKGLTKITELKPRDKVLGLKSGNPFWSIIDTVCKKPGQSRLLRIATDGSEVLISKNSEVFTVSGVKKASELSIGQMLETYNIPQEIRESVNDGRPIFVQSEIGPLRIDSKIAYVLGTQVRSPKFEDKVIIRNIDPNHAYEIARLCSEALKEQFISHKIYYLGGGKKIRIDCEALAEACKRINEKNIPQFIRQSNTTVLKYFLMGVLDTILCVSEVEDPPTNFITQARNSEFRRFILDCLRVFNIIPIKSYIFHPSPALTYVKTYVNPQDLRQLGLKFIKVKEGPRQMVYDKRKTMSYCTIRGINEFQGKLFSVQQSELHWSLIVDMTPLHKQVISSS
jgi:hypothetical protein